MLIFKNSLRKIWKSKGRFLSLIFIVILGTSFFAGVRETASDMLKTLDHYYDETSLYDFKIVSTMGLTEKDLESLKEIDGISAVEGGYSFDTLLEGNAVKVLSLTDISKVTLREGRMPENNSECLGEEGVFSLGDTVTIEDDTYLKENTCQVVGTIQSSSYIYENKGITTVGDGKLDSFLYVPKDNFKLDYYTEIYLLVDGAKKVLSYSSEYDDMIAKTDQKLQELKPLRETARYEEILKEAMDKVASAENELNDVKTTNEAKLNEALTTLNSNKIRLDEASTSYNNNLARLNQTKETTETELNNGFQALNEAKNEFNQALASAGLSVDSLQPTLDTLNSNIADLEKQLEGLDQTSSLYETLNATLTELKENKANIETLIATNQTLIEQETTLNTSSEAWNQQYSRSVAQLNSAKQALDQGYQELDQGYQEYNDNYNLYLEEIAKYEEEIAKAKEEINKTLR